jgi:predicted phage tail protein
MNVIRLHGSLEKHFGAEFEMDVSTAREAFIALCSQLEGFEARVRKGAFRVVRSWSNFKVGLDETTIDLRADNCTFHIYPAMVGSKSGLGKVLIGVAIIGLAIATSGASLGATAAAFGASMGASVGFLGITYASIATFGAMIALGGMAMMFAPSPKAQKASAGAKDESSFILNGPVNTPYQGGPVPLLYGEFLAGSLTISSEITIAQLIGAGGSYSSSTAWNGIGFPNYPGATSGAGGTGSGGSLTLGDISLPRQLGV